MILAYYPFTACGAHSSTPIFSLILLIYLSFLPSALYEGSPEKQPIMCVCVFILSNWLMRLQRLGGSKIWSDRLEGQNSSPQGVCLGNQEELMLQMKSEGSLLEKLLVHGGGQPLFYLVFYWRDRLFPRGSGVTNLPANAKDSTLGQEDPLEKGMATHCSILAWGISWTEEPVGYSPWGCKESDSAEWLSTRTHDRTTHSIWFQSFYICCSLFYDPGCGLSWSVLRGCLKRVSMLLLFGGQLYKCPLGPVAWWWFRLLLNLCWLCVAVSAFADSGVWKSLSKRCNCRLVYFFFQPYYIFLYTHTHTHTYTHTYMYICIFFGHTMWQMVS